MTADALSPVSVLCLAILFRGERTGYEIKKESVEGDYRYFVEASYGSIYPALTRLAAESYVTVREELQSGRPSKKVYALTEAGRGALLRALMQRPGPDVFRSRFLLVAKFATHLPAEVLRCAIDARREELERELDHLRAIGDADCENPAVAWIAAYGATCLSAELQYMTAHSDALIALAQPALADATP
ncbi:PadR family transcriptional regulator [Acuticoccus sp.]|uniref:PadR family transcriptional regulator n=1 Tax=Acuticoccus sp. TaxID=1904378 RepID=UPI003B517AC2